MRQAATLFVQNALRGAVLPLFLLSAWEIASQSGWLDPRFFPSLVLVAKVAIEQTQNGVLVHNLSASLIRNLYGLMIGGLGGVAFGLTLGLVRSADLLLGGAFRGLRQIAILAWIPIICMWFGLGEMAKIVFIAMAAFIPAAVNTRQGIKAITPQYIEVGNALCMTNYGRLRLIYIPAAMPMIAVGLHLSAMYSWVATIGSEYFMTNGPGIGGLIIAGRDRLQMELVIFGIIVLGIIGFLINTVMQRIFDTSLGSRLAKDI